MKLDLGDLQNVADFAGQVGELVMKTGNKHGAAMKIVLVNNAGIGAMKEKVRNWRI
jgi:hypothetical protein